MEYNEQPKKYDIILADPPWQTSANVCLAKKSTIRSKLSYHYPGSYTMSQCELCLVFKRGRIPKPRGARNVRQFLSEERREHSQKPEEIRKRIEEMFPTQNKIELFARQNVEGWKCIGNDIDGMDIRESIQSISYVF